MKEISLSSSPPKYYDYDEWSQSDDFKLKLFKNNETWVDSISEHKENLSKILREIDSRISEDLKVTTDILKVNKKYQRDFNKVSKTFENWAKQRRKTIKILNDSAKKMEYIRENCTKGKLLFSSISFLGSTASLVFNSFNNPWASKILFGAAAVGSLSFICSLFEVYICQSMLEDIYRTLRKDEELYETVMRVIRYGAINFDIYDLSPHGVSLKIMRSFMQPELMEYKERRSYDDLFKDFTSITNDMKIFYAILLTNILKDSEIMRDKEILTKLRTFSKSLVAEKWWNRLKFKNSSFHSDKVNLTSELKSFLKIDFFIMPFISFAAFPFSSNNYLNAITVAVLNGIISFDTFSEISIKIESKESGILRKLEDLIRKEYDELRRIYVAINPYND